MRKVNFTTQKRKRKRRAESEAMESGRDALPFARRSDAGRLQPACVRSVALVSVSVSKTIPLFHTSNRPQNQYRNQIPYIPLILRKYFENFKFSKN